MIDLSVIIPSYNTKQILENCINYLLLSLQKEKISYEIIVVDNASKDDSVDYLKKNKNINLIINKENLGYSKANNQGIKIAKGKYVLFLNSDVYVKNINLSGILDYLEKNTNIGALTVQVKRPSGLLDQACHRGFPTVWRSFCYFSRLEKIFGKIPIVNRLFGGYHLTYCDLNKIHEIDSASGAFYLARKEIIDKIKGFDEDFFMYGEDLDLSYRIKNNKYKIIFYPFDNVLHLKYQSGLNKDHHEIKNKTNNYFYQAMMIFYKKHYQKKYPWFINKLVFLMINSKLK